MLSKKGPMFIINMHACVKGKILIFYGNKREGREVIAFLGGAACRIRRRIDAGPAGGTAGFEGFSERETKASGMAFHLHFGCLAM